MDLMSVNLRDDEEKVPDGPTPLSKLLGCGVPESFALRLIDLMKSSRSYQEFASELANGCGTGLNAQPVLFFLATYIYETELLGAEFKERFSKIARLFDSKNREEFFRGPFIERLKEHLPRLIDNDDDSRVLIQQALVGSDTGLQLADLQLPLKQFSSDLDGQTSVDPSAIPWEDNDLATFVLNSFFDYLLSSGLLFELDEEKGRALMPEFLTALQKGLGVEFQIPRSETLKVDFVYSLGNVPANNIYGLQDGDCIRVLEIIELPGVYTSFVVAVFNSDGSERRIKDKGYVLRIPDALIDKMSLVQVMDLSNMKREGL